jgi:hypothetical protein
MKPFNVKVFLIAFLIILLLNFVSWAGLEAHNTPDRSHTLLGIIGSIWTILRFPVFTFFGRFLYSQNNVLLFSTAIFLNCVCYGFIIERMISLRKKKSKIPAVPTGN